MRPSPPWDSRAETSRCRQATRYSSWLQFSARARSASRAADSRTRYSYVLKPDTVPATSGNAPGGFSGGRFQPLVNERRPASVVGRPSGAPRLRGWSARDVDEDRLPRHGGVAVVLGSGRSGIRPAVGLTRGAARGR